MINRSGKGRYINGLDGLRALAVLSVISYHLHLPWMPGGLLGVSVFFVLSGYLITDLLLSQWQRLGKIDMKDFWIRRARRLLPAFLVMIGLVSVWIALFDPSRWSVLQPDLLPAITYVSNWWLIYHEVSYFESFGPASPLGHIWSLAVEEQFYILWPILLALALRYTMRMNKLAGLLLTGAALSAAAMAILYEPGLDPSRVYYGTDTRLFALLIGAALAIGWPSARLTERVSRPVRLQLDAAGLAAIATIAIMMGYVNDYDAFLYRGGMVLLSLASAILIAVIVHPVSLLGKALSWKPLRWLGVRSYGIYLWHYPVIVLSSGASDDGRLHMARAAVQVGVIIALAALSYRYIEAPIRKGGIEIMWKDWSRKGRSTLAMPVKLIVACFAAVLLLNLSYFGTVKLFSQPVSELLQPAEQEGAAQTKDEASGHPAPPVTNDNPDTNVSVTDSEGEDFGASPTGEPQTIMKSGKGVTAIGDSVLLGVQPYLEERLPGIHIEAAVGRQMTDALELVRKLQQSGKLGNRIIIELGTNGSFKDKQLMALLHALQDSDQVLLITARVPRPWEETVNEAIVKAAAQFNNTTVVDWHQASEGHNEYMGKDGVHLGAQGSKIYTELVASALKE
ncbi:acyltransferase family protein [Paenibacillus sp. GCM10023252]|uniref:acyltransferase family protein n=1 Tax=Paenibacillus sp. GCM10023252 TaxID=3252649 RepID=UPI00361198AB